MLINVVVILFITINQVNNIRKEKCGLPMASDILVHPSSRQISLPLGCFLEAPLLVFSCLHNYFLYNRSQVAEDWADVLSLAPIRSP